MKPFVFRLEAVQTLRESEEKEAYAAYGESIRERQRLEEACQSASQALRDLQENISHMRQSVFPASLQSHFFDHLQDAEARLNQFLCELSEAEGAEQKRLDAFLEAKAKVDVLCKLKDRRLESHTREESRKEEKEIEDLVNARFKRTLI